MCAKWRIILTLFFLYLQDIRSFQSFRQCFTNGLHVLRDTYATPTNENITPAYYVDDLYDVLGVSPNATKQELRNAYWGIAFQNHPDRNNSPESIHIFRNASYAYQILGRDEKTRELYDAKLKTRIYLNVLEEVGTEVIRPLAMEVAVPLINMTVQSIGNIAIPFFRDAIEQSTAVFQAAFNEEYSDTVALNIDGLPINAFERASIALEKKTLEQKIRGYNEKLSKTILIIDETMQQFQKQSIIEATSYKNLQKLKDDNEELVNTAEDIENIYNAAKQLYAQSIENENNAKDAYKSYIAAQERITKDIENVLTSITNVNLQIKQLEEELVLARQRAVELSKIEVNLQQELVDLKPNLDNGNAIYLLSQVDRVETEQSYTNAGINRKEIEAKAKMAADAITDATSDYNRQNVMKEILNKKLIQLNTKRSTFQQLLVNAENEMVQFIKRINSNTNPTKNESNKNKLGFKFDPSVKDN